MNLLKSLFSSKSVEVKTASPESISKQKIKYFRLKKDNILKHSGVKHDAGRIFVQWNSPANNSLKTWMLATPKLRRIGPGMDYYLQELITSKSVEEITIEDIQKLKPHWHKEFKGILEYYSK